MMLHRKLMMLSCNTGITYSEVLHGSHVTRDA
jgi:hypothetical protein